MPRKKKELAPAFQFYPRDWLASETVSEMSPAQEGAYIRLMCYAWLSGKARIPDDREKLIRLSRLSEAEWESFEPLFKKVFKKSIRVPFVYQPRLQKEQQKQDKYHEAQRKKGAKSGEVRRNKANRCSLPVATEGEPDGEPKRTLPSASSSAPAGISPYGEITPPTPSEAKPEPAPESRSPAARCESNGKATKRSLDTPEFREWYAAYPRRLAPKAAAKAYAGAVRELIQRGRSPPEAQAFLLDAAREFARSEAGRRESQFVPHPATWLNQERYDDDRSEWNRTNHGGRTHANGPGQLFAGHDALGEV